MKALLKPASIVIQVLCLVAMFGSAKASWLRTGHLQPSASARHFRVRPPQLATGVRYEGRRTIAHRGFAAIVRNQPRAQSAVSVRSDSSAWVRADIWLAARLKIPPSGSAAIDPLA